MPMFPQLARAACAAATIFLIAAGSATAQIAPNVERPLYPGGEVNGNPADPGAVLPRDDVVEAMAKNALMTLNDANLTGNYGVFHARLHSVFRDQKSAADLAGIFAPFRAVRIDLAPALVHRAIFVEPPRINDQGHLVAKGFFETRPWRTNFDLIWGREGKSWSLLKINVQARPPDQ